MLGWTNVLGNVLKLEILSQGLAGSCGQLVSSAEHGSRDDHHLTAVSVIEAVLALAGKNVGSHVGDIAKGDGGELVVLADGDGQQSLGLGLVGVGKEVLSVESGTDP